MIAEENRNLKILPLENLLFKRKQRISLSSTKFPAAYHMHAGNLEDKGKISSCMSNEVNTRFTFP